MKSKSKCKFKSYKEGKEYKEEKLVEEQAPKSSISFNLQGKPSNPRNILSFFRLSFWVFCLPFFFAPASPYISPKNQFIFSHPRARALQRTKWGLQRALLCSRASGGALQRAFCALQRAWNRGGAGCSGLFVRCSLQGPALGL